MARPLSLYTRYTFLKPGFVIFSTDSEILMRGSHTPFFSTPAILYTAPNTGSLLEVISLSPTPKISMGPPCPNKEVIVYSSRLLEAIILQSSKPALSSIRRAFLAK